MLGSLLQNFEKLIPGVKFVSDFYAMKVPLLLLIAFSICANSSSHQRNLEVPPHPRLILNGDDIARIWTNIKKYPLATTLFERLKNHSETLMQGGDIRDTSYSLGLMYRLTNDTRYARAGIQNLLKLAANKDACQGCNGDCSKLETGCPGPMCGQSVAPRSRMPSRPLRAAPSW